MIYNDIRKSKLKYLLYTYFLFHIIYFSLIHFTNIFEYNPACYFVIIINTIISFILMIIFKHQKGYLIFLAQTFTLLADYFCVLTNTYELIGVSSFTIVQVFYYLYIIHLNNNKINKQTLFLRIFSTIIFIIIGIILEDLLTLITLNYFFLLFINFIESINTTNKNIIFTIGLLLFILCDINVGLYNLSEILNSPENSFLYQIVYTKIDLIWVFYHPSQVLLSLSLLFKKQPITF